MKTGGKSSEMKIQYLAIWRELMTVVNDFTSMVVADAGLNGLKSK